MRWLILHEDTSDYFSVDYVQLNATYIKGLIFTIPGSIPFYTIDPNPANATSDSCLINMIPGDSCLISWPVNATGALETVHEFFVYTNSTTYSQVTNNESEHINITISDAAGIPPVVTLVAPPDATLTSNASLDFTCTVTDNTGLTSLSLYADFSGTFTQVDQDLIGGTSNGSTFTQSPPEGNFVWNCLAIDTDANTDWGDDNRTITIDRSAPTVTLNSPANNEFLSTTYALLNYTPTDTYSALLTCNVTVDGSILSADQSVASGGIGLFNASELSQGLHSWNATCVDAVGYIGYSPTYNFSLSDAPPSVILVTPDNTTFSTGNVDLAYFPQDNSLISSATLYINGAPNETDTTVTKGINQSFNLTGVSEGTYIWTVNVTDNGNLSAVAPERTFIVDLTAPTITLLAPPNESSTDDGDVTFNFTVSDNFDTDLTCDLITSAGINQTNISATNGSITSATLSLPDGLTSWNVTCLDNGGLSSTSQTWTINVSQPPSVTLTRPEEGYGQQNSDVQFYYVPDDNNAIDACILYINGAQNASDNTISIGINNSFEVLGFAEGAYNWTVTCNDTLGSLATTETRNFTIDLTSPNVTLSAPPNGTNVYAQYVEFNFTAYDNLAPLILCNITVDDIQEATLIPALNGQLTTVNVTGITEAQHWWNVTCADAAGNTNVSDTWTFTFFQPPTVELLSPEDGAYLTNISVDLIYLPDDNDDVTSAKLYIDGILNQTEPSPIAGANNTFNLSIPQERTYTWFVSVTDTGGLVTNSTPRTFTADRTAPAITIHQPSEDQTMDWNEIVFNFTAT
ncbi:MAG: hypothetical protein HC945_03290, partial [Nitrosarchaeum sp.]|nr:hypothetical protein [Nitrosarchaeum sp.]